MTKEEKVLEFKKTMDLLLDATKDYYEPKEVKLSLDEWNEKFGKIMDCMKKIGTMYVEELGANKKNME